MAKNNARKNATATADNAADNAPAVATAPANAIALDWQAESALMVTLAKEKGGDRGNKLAKVAQYVATDAPGAAILRAAASKPDALNGAHAFANLSRNTLSKLQKLGERIASGQPWCALAALEPSATRTEDASVAVALGQLGGLADGASERQKNVVAGAVKRYPGGNGAQMGAALDALAFVGILARANNDRNAPYTIADREAADKLIPKA